LTLRALAVAHKKLKTEVHNKPAGRKITPNHPRKSREQ